MSQNRQQIEYDILPPIDTVEDAALHVLEMLNIQGHYYTPGIFEAFYAVSIAMTEEQFGLIDKFSSAQLSAKFEKVLGEGIPEDMPQRLERAFWSPIHASAKQILNPVPEDNVEYNTVRLYASAKLYAVIDACISNMRLMMRSGLMREVEVDSQNKLGNRPDREVYTAMPAEQTLHVLKRGFLPQLKNAISRQFGVDDQTFAKMVQIVKDQWDSEDAALRVDFIKPIDRLEWMQHGRLPSKIAYEEAEQARKDFGVSPIPPQND